MAKRTIATQDRVKVPDVKEGRTPDFSVFSAPLTVVKHDDNDGPQRVLATASSTAIDLESDRFTRSALVQMRDGFQGRLIFLNHSYRVPTDVFGVVDEVKIVRRDGRSDLDMVISVEQNNPLAQQTFAMIEGGTRLGVSVGVIVTEADKSDDEDDDGHSIIDITGVVPLEASIVGIPANQTAWTQQAIKSLFSRGAIDLDDEEVAARPWLKETDMSDENKDKDTLTSSEDVDVDDDATDEVDEETVDDSIDTDDTEDVDTTDTDPDDTEDEIPDETDSEESPTTTDTEPDETDDLAEDVNADLAADDLIDKMFSGFRMTLWPLVDLMLDVDLTVAERRSAGMTKITEFQEFVAETWEETMDSIEGKSLVSGDEAKGAGGDLAARTIHALMATEDTVTCYQNDSEAQAAMLEKVGEIANASEALADDNNELREELEQKTQALKLMEEVLDAIMQLPLPTVTTAAKEQVARSLAEEWPDLDTRVVQRMARYAPVRNGRQDKKES